MELPAIQNSTYACNNYTMGATGLESATFGDPLEDTRERRINFAQLVQPIDWDKQAAIWQQAQNQPQQDMSQTSTRRIVQVFIVDPNENVPLERAILFQDEKPHLTDLTDQELFFEIDIKGILDKHNEYRVTLENKESVNRLEGKAVIRNLEKARVRDLRMNVVTVAQF